MYHFPYGPAFTSDSDWGGFTFTAIMTSAFMGVFVCGNSGLHRHNSCTFLRVRLAVQPER
jgi:hypothetical protein